MAREIAEVYIPEELHKEFYSRGEDDFIARWIEKSDISLVKRNLRKIGLSDSKTEVDVVFVPESSSWKLENQRTVKVIKITKDEDGLPDIKLKRKFVMRINVTTPT